MNEHDTQISGTLKGSFMRAHELAADLMAHSMATYPAEFIHLIGKRIENIAIEYAVHVRRLIEAQKKLLPQIDALLPFQMKGQFPSFERDFKRCLNAIIHSNQLETIFLPKDKKIFIAHHNVQAVSLKVKTDKFSEVNIPIFGIAFFFFSHVIDQIEQSGVRLQ